MEDEQQTCGSEAATAQICPGAFVPEQYLHPDWVRATMDEPDFVPQTEKDRNGESWKQRENDRQTERQTDRQRETERDRELKQTCRERPKNRDQNRQRL